MATTFETRKKWSWEKKKRRNFSRYMFLHRRIETTKVLSCERYTSTKQRVQEYRITISEVFRPLWVDWRKNHPVYVDPRRGLFIQRDRARRAGTTSSGNSDFVRRVSNTWRGSSSLRHQRTIRFVFPLTRPQSLLPIAYAPTWVENFVRVCSSAPFSSICTQTEKHSRRFRAAYSATPWRRVENFHRKNVSTIHFVQVEELAAGIDAFLF